MAQTGYTPIQLYYSSTSTNEPTAGNLANGELAINIADGKLFYKNGSGVVSLIATNATAETSGASILYGDGSGGFSNVTIGSGLTFSAGTLASTDVGGTVTSVDVSGGTTGLTTSGGPITSSGTITLAGTLAVANGGTGATTSTGSGAVVLATSPTLASPVFTGSLTEEVYALSGDDLVPANGTIQTKTLSTNTTFTESLSAGESLILMLVDGASYTVTWPTMTWATASGNVAPTLTAADTIVFWKVSTTLYGAYVGSYA